MTDTTVPTEVVWGTGYGSKRHVVREGTRKDEPKKQWGRDRYAEAACSSTIFLSFFSDVYGDDPAKIMRLPACPRCAKKVALVPCGTCGGSGQVSA